MGHGIYFQPTYCIWINAETILLFLKQDPEVAHLAAVYLRWVSLGLPGMAFLSPDPSKCFSYRLISLCFQLYQPVCPKFPHIRRTCLTVGTKTVFSVTRFAPMTH